MIVYTMGFTKKNAQDFFSKIKTHQIELVIDIRLNNNSQLAGFTKGRDLGYFLRELCNADYIHGVIFAPTKELLADYKHGKISWEEYEAVYAKLYDGRHMAEYFDSKFSHYSNVLLLCSEATPEMCHRRLLAEALRKDVDGVIIKHL